MQCMGLEEDLPCYEPFFGNITQSSSITTNNSNVKLCLVVFLGFIYR